MGQFGHIGILFIVMSLRCNGFIFTNDECDVIPAPGCRCTVLTHPDVTCSGLGLDNMSDLDIGTGIIIGHLDLSLNDFGELPNGAFKGMLLKSLDISETSRQLKIQSRAFSGVIRSRLESLNLKATRQAEVPPAMSRLRNLVKLDLSMNNIQGIRAKDFENFPNLQTLYLEGNPIRVINRFLFSDNPQLNEFSLSAKDSQSFGENGGFCNYLQGTFSVLDVQYMTLSSLALRGLSCFDLLPNLNFLAVVDNGLDDTKLGTIPSGEDIEYLDTLLIEDNQLKSFPSHLKRFPYLRFLSLRGNRISQVFNDDLRGFQRLTHLNLAENQLLIQHMETYLVAPSLESLDLSNNVLSTLDAQGLPDGFPDVSNMSINISGNEQMSCAHANSWLICLVGRQAATGRGPFSLYDVYTLPCKLRNQTQSTFLDVYREYPRVGC